ncbi:hypothetical protein FACS1894104_5880 [Actinomycetota bacterium]|nr:hypothetical protein FACS1894104_5880 [Actinomycetota bacterium]
MAYNIDMKLYHGSYVAIDKPRVDINTRGLDFGDGFYLSDSFEQGKSFALRFANQNRTRKLGISNAVPTVSEYDFDLESACKNCNIKRFDNPSYEWFDFVVANRNKVSLKEVYDIVIGPIADDQVLTTIRLYEDKVISKDEAMTRFLTSRLDDQVVIKSNKALDYVTFIKATTITDIG